MEEALVTEWIGSIAAILTTSCFFLQVLHIVKHRDVAAISLGMYAMFSTGVCLWLVYGIRLMSWPIILANIVTLILVATIIYMKLKYSKE